MSSSDYEDPFFLKPRSVEEIAKRLGASQAFVYREVVRGRLRGLKFTPKTIRVLPSDLRQWIEQAATKRKRKQKNAAEQLQEA
jgi:excisionase family DNA binding protein